MEQHFAFIKKTIDKLKTANKEIKTINEDECLHENTVICDGATVCTRCGETLEFLFDNHDIMGRKNLDFRPYEKKKHIRDLLKRISGHYFKEKLEPNLEEMPKDLKKIRKYLKEHKLNQKNDLYYYRLKNNIDIKIPGGEIYSLESEFNSLKNRGKKISPKDFIYSKLKDIEKYKEILVFVKRINQIQSKDC